MRTFVLTLTIATEATMNPFLSVILQTAGVYVFIIAALRLFGKKELAQLSVIDLVFILLISNSVQNAMVEASRDSFLAGLVAAGTLFLLNYILKFISFRSRKITRLIQGEPVILMHKGKLLEHNLHKENISEEELQAAMREHGVEKEADVDLAVLEADGNISILSHNYQKHSQRRRRAHKAVTKNT